MSRLAKFAALNRRKRSLLLRAWLWLAIMRLALLLFPLRRIASFVGLQSGASERSEIAVARRVRAEDIGWAVRTASRHTPWLSTCLVQALAGCALLRWQGLPATLYLGIARDGVTQDFEAHAWLSCGGEVLTGEEESRRFQVLTAFAAG